MHGGGIYRSEKRIEHVHEIGYEKHRHHWPCFVEFALQEQHGHPGRKKRNKRAEYGYKTPVAEFISLTLFWMLRVVIPILRISGSSLRDRIYKWRCGQKVGLDTLKREIERCIQKNNITKLSRFTKRRDQ